MFFRERSHLAFIESDTIASYIYKPWMCQIETKLADVDAP
jgi:hypothetical protein